MKTKILKINSRIMIAILIVASVISCKKITNPLDNMQLLIDYNIVKTTIDVHIRDAATGKLLDRETSKMAMITVSGSDAEAVVDVLGMAPKNNKFPVNQGIANMALSPKSQYIPDQNNVISFALGIELPGYLPTSKQVNINQAGRSFITLEVIPVNNPPSGVKVKQAAAAAQTGTNGKVVAPATVSVSGGDAAVHIPQGIVMRDAQGGLLTGNLNVTLVHFDLGNSAAQASFPGGMLPRVKKSDGSIQSGMFYSAGCVAVEITDDQGKQAATFSDGTLALTTAVSEGTFNPVSQTNITEGDIVPVWSMSGNSGLWNEEGYSTVNRENGILTLTTELPHLSYYSFNWFTGTLCEEGRPFRFTTDRPLEGSFLIKGKVYRQEDNCYLNTILMWATSDQLIPTSWVPQGVGVNIEWDMENSPFLQPSPGSQPTFVDEWCGSSPIPVELLINDGGGLTTLTVSVSLYCPDDPDVVIKPSFMAYYRNISNDGPVIPVEMVEGIATVSGIYLGDTYEIWMIYDGEEYTTEINVTQNEYSYMDVEIPADVCDEVFGGN
ncbi:MAG: hypothetical protein M0Q41_06955 [Bacteroidales bacterium]|nr:hypothetical protein [Bacteroidales bacterium]